MEIKFTLEGHKDMQRALVQLRGQDIDKALATGFRRAATPIPGYMARAAKTYYTAKQRELKDRIRKPDVKPSPTGRGPTRIASFARRAYWRPAEPRAEEATSL